VVGYLALGSNIGDRETHLREGLGAIVRAGISVTALSSVWETEPVDGAGPDPFLNMAARIETDLPPEQVLAAGKAAERARGRVRLRPNAPRELDVDLLVLGDLARDDPSLTLPHPRMWERRFVLAPLVEIAPGLVRAATGRSAAEELAALRDAHGVRRVGALYTSEGAPLYSRAL
jgi:2-amino-4-hydroxy-6-hydroxymethyldihydropteridine diphosphokinase